MTLTSISQLTTRRTAETTTKPATLSKELPLSNTLPKPGRTARQVDPIGTGTVTASALNVRSGAGTNFPRIGGLTKGKTFNAYEEKNGWLKIGYGSDYGWISKTYTDYKPATVVTPEPDPEPEPTPSTFQVKTTDPLNLRDIPGNGGTPASGSTVILTIPEGTVLTVTDQKNGWYKVEYNGKSGWVCANFTVEYDPSKEPEKPVITDEGVMVDVTLKAQQTNYTCGSASGAMCATTYSGKTVTESQIWNYANSGGQGTYVYAITNAINYYLKQNGKSGDYKYKQTTSDAQFFKGVKASLSKNAPVEMQLKPSTLAAFGYQSSGHYVVASGAFEENGVPMLRITDPFSAKWTSGAPKGQVFNAKVSDIRKSITAHSNYVMLHGDASV